LKNANNFDGLRLLGALFVLFSHQFAISGRPEPLLFAGAKFSTFGALGVYMFFSISGYLVCQSWLADADAHRFIQRRFLRIWPGMAVAIVITAIAATLATGADGWTLVSYLRNVACLRCDDGLFFRGSAQTTLYGSLWTIPLEVQCYALLLTAGMLARSRLGLLAAALAVLAMLPNMPFAADFDLAGYHWPVGVVGAFFLGGCLICFHEQLLRRAWLPILGGLALIAHGDYQAATIFIVPPAVIWIGRQSWPLLRSAGRFGDLSYGIYLYAWAVQQLGVVWLGKNTSVWFLMAVSLLVSTALAFTSWHLVEKRALRLKPRRPTAADDAAAEIEIVHCSRAVSKS
jgi:peptidoglycan/LPS O-acetylase OafA/YrhL